MRKGSSRSGSARHQQFRARAKTRVDDLQDMFSGLQYARKEARSTDAVVLEAQLHQMLREWRAELSVPSPASSLQGNNLEPSGPPSETPRQLQLAKAEEEDDATSRLVEQQPPPPANQALKREQGGQDMKPEPSEEQIADPVTAAQQPSPLAQGAIAAGGGLLPPAAAVFHDQGNNREPSETPRQLQLAKAEEEEEDDATSRLVEQQPPPPANQALKHEQGGQDMKPEPSEEQIADPVTAAQQPPSLAQGAIAAGGGLLPPAAAVFHDQMYYVNQELTVEDFLYDDDYKINLPGSNPEILNNLEGICHQEYPQFNFPQELPPNAYLDMNNYGQSAGDVFLHMSDLLTTMAPEPAAFLRPKCALWDCPRPAQGSERWQDYCSMYHAELAVKEEGPPGTMPVIRPRGIDLKDGPLFAALGAKTQGKHVGIPVCEGAATAKSPWNAPELFDLYIFEGESIREWLFFDKPRTAFHSGNRKQRSLPDYNGRGWHESRKQVMKEFGGLKRSYYMDPQPSSSYEWHLYEYEINDCDTFALYRLEFKSSDAKKSAKSKLACNPLNEIQQQMVRLSADSPVENKRTARARTKDVDTNIYSVQNNTVQANNPNVYQAVPQVDQMAFLNGNVVYGPHLPYGYSTERSDFYWNSNDGA